MSPLSIVVLLAVAGVCGSIGRRIAGSSRSGCLGAIALGFIGALIGHWVARHLHLPELIELQISGESFPVVWSIAGSAIFVAMLGIFSRRRD